MSAQGPTIHQVRGAWIAAGADFATIGSSREEVVRRFQASAARPSATGASKRLVVVDDDADFRQALCLILVDLEYQVVGEGADANAGIELARSAQPDLVLMDAQLPDRDGIEAAEQIRRELGPPVLLVTGFAEPERVQRALAAGTVGYLVKPFSPSQLRASIEVATDLFAALCRLSHDVRGRQQALDGRNMPDGDEATHRGG